MLNIFPIQFLAPVAYLFLRVCVGTILIRLGFIHIKNRQILKDVLVFPSLPYGLFFAVYLGVFEIIVGSMFVLGLFTQIAALLTIVFSLKMIFMHKYFLNPLIPTRLSFFLIFTIACTLFVTGAGILAFDLPI
ncbi:MAG: DoxX family protein [Candidatus Pacebacteria bacterium]|nr:DoxX family protein [Candidatus Paceibacterota bacterium]MCF7857657.1 DoxX family protein [Candidatus Paceibacterota bacterium]